MKALRLVFACGVLMGAGSAAFAAETIEGLPQPSEILNSWAVGNVRSVEHKATDVTQHPVMMMMFAGMTEGSSVVEIAPTDTYWSEFLGGVVQTNNSRPAAGRSASHFIEAVDQTDTKAWDQATKDKNSLKSEYNIVVDVVPLAGDSYGAAGTTDIVILQRKMAALMRAGDLQQILASALKSLKPGGVLLVEDYRASGRPEGDYVRENDVVSWVRKAGFKLAARDNKLLANPKDARSATSPDSDRFLLKFEK
jgi:predicted methyltransferase